ncbi:MAG TPA: TIM barrel protein [Terriglobia bacterium]|nr:TIM barrel protein [Terriglobia bacterium]
MKRREFISSLLAGVVASAAGRPASPQHPRRRAVHRVPSPLDRVCVSTRSFKSYFDVTQDSALKSASERLVLLDFPQIIADRYKVHNLEFVAQHFASLEPAYLQALKSNLVAAQSRLINLAVDIEELGAGGGLSDPDAAVRNAAIETCKNWIDTARQLGARSVRCDPGGMNPDDLSLTIDSYRKLAAYGRPKSVAVLIENRGDIGAAHPEALVQIFRAVGGAFIGALPDFGDFPDNATRLRGLPLLFRYARTVCHARDLKLDSGDRQPGFDFQQCVQISKDAGFRGVHSIEYESGVDAYAGVQSVIDELVRLL